MLIVRCLCLNVLIAEGGNALAASGTAEIAVFLAGRSQRSEMPFLPMEMKGSMDAQLIYQAYSAQI